MLAYFFAQAVGRFMVQRFIFNQAIFSCLPRQRYVCRLANVVKQAVSRSIKMQWLRACRRSRCCTAKVWWLHWPMASAVVGSAKRPAKRRYSALLMITSVRPMRGQSRLRPNMCYALVMRNCMHTTSKVIIAMTKTLAMSAPLAH